MYEPEINVKYFPQLLSTLFFVFLRQNLLQAGTHQEIQYCWQESLKESPVNLSLMLALQV